MPSTAIQTKRETHGGEFDACGHRISFWYDLDECELTDDLAQELEDEAERRAREMIAEDYTSGELSCSVDNDDNEHEFTGWWNVERS